MCSVVRYFFSSSVLYFLLYGLCSVVCLSFFMSYVCVFVRSIYISLFMGFVISLVHYLFLPFSVIVFLYISRFSLFRYCVFVLYVPR